MILISGPCVIENERNTLDLAEGLKRIADEFQLSFFFKASFDKANRTSINSFRGVGIEKGLRILKKVRDDLDIMITTDVHECWQVEEVSSVVDMIQIPALLSRQTDLITTAARTQKMINIKKGQFMTPWDMKHAIEKIERQGNKQIVLTERGVCFGYNNLIFDVKSIPIMKAFGYPVVIDASHLVQKPSAGDGVTTGDTSFISTIAKAGIAAGADGVFIEVHENPEEAKCDKDNCLDLKGLKRLIDTLLNIRKLTT